MEDLMNSGRTRPVAIWLLAGVFMIMVQVMLGGITRLTGSGLSITDWDPIMGAIPPLNHGEWMTAFHQYQQTPQYRLLNSDFTLSNFKFIFFWEWFHRLWARLLGVVFLIPFFIFLIQKRFTRSMIKPMIILFLLGALQGVVGWIMVESGLVGDNVSVNHFKLAAHFITAMILLCYTLWFALSLLVRPAQRTVNPSLKKLTVSILVILTIQLVYGSFMAGLHAALAAPTWPSMNGAAVPYGMFRMQPVISNIADNVITVQFIHRGLAYLLTVLIIIWFFKALKSEETSLLHKLCWLPLAIVILQVTLGVLTVLGSTVHIPIDLAVAHQFGGMMLLEAIFIMIFLVRQHPIPVPAGKSIMEEQLAK
jgi:cytochrome c oxidase assembly protein subunit 15